jgi:shikimate dehydrogenase
VTQLAAVIGWPVAHSRSPAMMNAAFAACGIDARMDPIAVPPEDLREELAKLRALPMLGASVTVPHKLEVAKLCDELVGDASALGAVNCLVMDGERLVGHNTDVAGFRDSLLQSGVHAGRAIVLGGGGSARAIDHALRTAGATVEVAARRTDAVTWTSARAWSELPELFAHADLVVDCTPTGLDPEQDAAFAAALPLASLHAQAVVATLVYHRRTQLLELAAARGHRTLDGRLMLVHQAAHAFTLWTARPAPISSMTRAFDESP